MTWPLAALILGCLFVVAASGLAALWLRQRAAQAIRDEQRVGVVAEAIRRMDVMAVEFKALRDEQKLFIANQRGARG